MTDKPEQCVARKGGTMSFDSDFEMKEEFIRCTADSWVARCISDGYGTPERWVFEAGMRAGISAMLEGIILLDRVEKRKSQNEPA